MTHAVVAPPLGTANLTVAQTQAVLNVSRPTIYRLIDKGLLKRIKILNCARITADSVNALLAS